jgi:hypothetical protein
VLNLTGGQPTGNARISLAPTPSLLETQGVISTQWAGSRVRFDLATKTFRELVPIVKVSSRAFYYHRVPFKEYQLKVTAGELRGKTALKDFSREHHI